MVGIKGRSGGKATTKEAKALKAAATRTREERKARVNALKGKIGDPVTYGDLLKSVQVDGEMIQNERRAIEVERAMVELGRAKDERDLAAGKQVSREWHAKEVMSMAELFLARLSQITDAAISLVQPEQQPSARHTMDRAVAAYRKDIVSAAKDGTK